jgi:RNA polymerase sigma-70 factor, ECF subfamily
MPMVSPQSTDDELMRAVQQGDRSAFEVLFRRHAPMVLRYSTVLTGNRDKAQDLAQEAFLKMYAQRLTYHGRGFLKSWLCTVCRHTFIDQCRKRGVPLAAVELPEVPVDALLPAEGAAEMGKEAFLEHPLLVGLSLAHREILFLRVVEELSYGEISALTGQTAEGLRQIVSRALQALRVRMQKEVRP